jgi:hypothetical protein
MKLILVEILLDGEMTRGLCCVCGGGGLPVAIYRHVTNSGVELAITAVDTV